jgi:quercetin dioxygenase-like cupin family protein
VVSGQSSHEIYHKDGSIACIVVSGKGTYKYEEIIFLVAEAKS